MSKKKITLEEAKEILKSDKVFYNGNNKFNVLDVGKYNSRVTLEIPQDWSINEYRKSESPINYSEVKELTDGMNVDFDGRSDVLFGRYRLSKNNKPVFELTEPTKAKDVLIRVNWGGPFNSSRGQYKDYANEIGAIYFTRCSSNGGGAGCDYWVLPVDFVYGMESRDVSSILESVEQKEKERIAKIDEKIAKEDFEKRQSIENKDRILRQIEPIIEQIKEYDSEFKYEAKEDKIEYKGNFFSMRERKYTDELIKEMEEALETLKKEKSLKEEYMPKYKEMEFAVNSLGMTLECGERHATLVRGAYKTYYSYTSENYNSFIKEIKECQEKIEKEKEEARIEKERIKREAELRIKKEEAKKMGYPEVYEHWNRLYGKTNLGHAYVVEKNGTIREPDYNNLRNSNHKHNNHDWKNNSDGTQGYEQILPGEVIISYEKDFTAAPYILDVEWADDEITEAQLEEICTQLEEKEDLEGFVQSTERQEIKDIRQWLIDKVRAKAKECKNNLNIKSEEKFAEDILELAEEKNTAEEKNKKAEELEKEFEEKLGENNKKNIGDE